MRTKRAILRPTVAASLLALALVLFACVQITDPPDPSGPPDPDDLVEVSLASDQEIAAVQVRFSYDPATMVLAGVRLFDEGVVCKLFDDGVGMVTVALVHKNEGMTEDVISVFFERRDPASTPMPEVVNHDAYTFEELRVDLRSESSAATGGLPEPDACSSTAASSDSLAPTSLGTASTPLDLQLQPSFADFRLGNATGQDLGDDAVDVLDVLRVLKIATEAISSPTDFEYYHSDLNGDALVDTRDVLTVLDKAVDPTLPAELHVAPRLVTFAYAKTDGPILVNNAGNESLSSISISPTGGVSVYQLGGYGISGQSAAYSVDVGSTWSNGAATVSSGSGGSIDVAVGNIAILIAGQSNASGFGEPLSPPEPGIPPVRMFGNDYQWKQAYEPLDDETGQVDSVSLEDPYSPDHSFGVRLGKELHAATQSAFDGFGRYVYLIPSARQGSVVNTEANATWRPATNRLDRSTLFGSANYRAQTSAGAVSGSPYAAEGGPVSAIAWYQGESDAGQSSRRQAFIANTNAVMDAFTDELGGVSVLYVQLATHTAVDTNNSFQSLRERQRLMESGVPSVSAGLGSPQPRSDFHMVVAHDLPMTDSVHLSKAGQLILAERLALAFREHVLGEPIDGTGPRLQGVSLSGSTIKVDTTRPINDDSDYGGYFRVYLASNPSTELTISQIRRDPGDATAVQITLASTPPGGVLVVYKPPPNRPTDTQIADVVKDPSTGLPLPAFGSTID